MKKLRVFVSLVGDSFNTITTGSKKYHLWMGLLTLIMLMGMYCYSIQLDQGLSVTGMTDRVSRGLYISNFTFLVGVAAAAVILVMPTYILKDIDFKQAVLIGEGLAVSALLMCLAFVVADMGGPSVLWHMIPGIGVFNFPNSMLTWDVIVLNGYLFLNITIPFYILFRHYQEKKSKASVYVPGTILSVFWAVGIHLVTTFLYQGLPARPFWNNALLGPRFLASAFAAGPALIILVLAVLRTYSAFEIKDQILTKLTIHKLRSNFRVLFFACTILFIAVWIEKGFGLIVPGFVPGPYGKIVEYTPAGVEIGVTIGIWAMGVFIFTILAKTAIGIETGVLRYKGK